MIYHVLPGDAQVEAFKQSGIAGEILVCRECLIEGDLNGDGLDEFFINRAAFINNAFDQDPANYNSSVASQFRKLTELTDRDEVNLWFEYELFCAVNMWFCLDLLSKTDAKIYRVMPVYLSEEDRWDGFGGATSNDMLRCFDGRIQLTDEDIRLGSALFKAYKNKDKIALNIFTDQGSDAFPFLREVVEAAIEIDTRPSEIVSDITRSGKHDLSEVFPEFRSRAGVYGFGDTQVENLIKKQTA
jgi:hypothetical protein